MSAAWITIVALAAGTIAIKATGPMALGGRRLPPRLDAVIMLLAPSLLAALVAVQTFGGRGLTVDARVAGLLAAMAAVALRRSMTVVVLVAAVATAGIRALA